MLGIRIYERNRCQLSLKNQSLVHSCHFQMVGQLVYFQGELVSMHQMGTSFFIVQMPFLQVKEWMVLLITNKWKQWFPVDFCRKCICDILHDFSMEECSLHATWSVADVRLESTSAVRICAMIQKEEHAILVPVGCSYVLRKQNGT